MSEKYLPKRKKMRMTSHDYSANGVYFITICTKNRRCLLSRIVGTGVPDGPHVALTAHGEVAEKYLLQLNGFYNHLSIDQYVIMPNHIHLLLSVKGGPSGTPVPTGGCSAQNSVVARFVSTFKRFCNKEYGENIWQARSYDHIIRNRGDYEDVAKYIFENPLRWHLDELYSEA